MIENFFNLNEIGTVSIFDFLIGLVEITALSIIIKFYYDKYAFSVSNRKSFSFQFIPYSISIYLIIVVIKSSLVLSLGLVGALSIIRFRTAIKEPEQIITLLYLTGMSISLAAGKLILPIISTAFLSVFYLVRYYTFTKEDSSDKVLYFKFKDIDLSLMEDILLKLKDEFGIDMQILNFKKTAELTTFVFNVSKINIRQVEKVQKLFSNYDINIDEISIY
jgi:hypothetical protein